VPAEPHRGLYVARQPIDEHLAGAVLGLAFAIDEDGARYWLAMCARRGADADTLRELRTEWERQHAADVQTLHTGSRPRRICPLCDHVKPAHADSCPTLDDKD